MKFKNKKVISAMICLFVTLILSIPTMISGYFGMNVDVPFANDPYGFWIILFISAVICVILSILLSKNKLL